MAHLEVVVLAASIPGTIRKTGRPAPDWCYSRFGSTRACQPNNGS